MTKLTSVLLAMFFVVLLFSPVQAQGRVGFVNDDANLRSGPGRSYQIVGFAQRGERIVVVGQNEAGSWYRLEGGEWIAAILVDIASTSDSKPLTLEVKGLCNAAAENIARGVDESDPARLAVGLQELEKCATSVNIYLASLNRPVEAPAQPTATSVRVEQPVVLPTATPIPPTSTPVPPTATPSQQCDPSYPDFCLAPGIPDLDCKDIPHRRFRVLQPDPHRFDGDKDGIGCE